MYPEQQQALDYLRTRGTEAPAASVRSRLHQTLSEFEVFLRTIPAAAQSWQPAPGKWSAHEVLDHLVLSHRPAIEQLRAVIAGDTWPTPVPAHLLSPKPFDRAFDDLIRDLESVHRAILFELEKGSDDNLIGRAPVAMVVKCRGADATESPVEWLESFDWKAFALTLRAHTLEHRAQIARTLALFVPE